MKISMIKKGLWTLLVAAAFVAQTVAPSQAQFRQQAQWGACGGTANAQTMALPNVGSLGDLVGVQIACIAGVANTGPATLSVGALGSVTIKKAAPSGLAALAGGEINGPIIYLYDGSEFVITGPATSYAQVIPPHNSWSQTVHGTYTFTVPAGVYWVNVTVVGAGGGGGAGGGNLSGLSGGGGGSGGTAEGWVAVMAGQNLTAVVGQGGVGASSNGVIAGTGGNSSFGGLTATGGVGGVLTTGQTSAGGPGGAATGGQFNFPGAPGGDGDPYVTQVPGGGGGASSQGGGGRTATIGLPASTVANGIAPGSGGGGIWGANAGNSQGGNGADGVVIVSY